MKGFLLFVLLFTGQLLLSQPVGLALEGEEWQGVSEYPVKGKNGLITKQQLRFGNFYTTDIDRSWTKGWETTTGLTSGHPMQEDYQKIITVDKSYKKQTFYFALEDSTGMKSQAFCLTEVNAKDFNLGNNPVSIPNLILDLMGPGAKTNAFLYTRIYLTDAAGSWEMLIDPIEAFKHPKEYVGYIAKSPNEYYKIIPATRILSNKGKAGNIPFGAAGFIIRNAKDEPLAAVSLIENSFVYLKDVQPEERILLATICSAFLLYPEDL